MASTAPQLYIKHKISGVYSCLHLPYYSCYANVFIGSLPIHYLSVTQDMKLGCQTRAQYSIFATLAGSNFRFLIDAVISSLRFLCRPTAFFRLAGAVGCQRALHKENSRFASPTLGRHISTFHGYQKPLYKSLHQSFFYSFITILPSESGVALHYSMILP